MKMPKSLPILLSLLLLCLISPAHAAGYAEPALKCAEDDYWGVFAVENQSSDDPVLLEAEGCSILKKLVVDSSKGCEAIENDIGDDYILTEIPVCSSTVEDFREQGYDVFGEMIGGRTPPATGVSCPGQILGVTSHVFLEDGEIDINVSYMNTGNKECGYEVCIYGKKDPSSEDWQKMGCREKDVASGEVVLAEFTSRETLLQMILRLIPLVSIISGDWGLEDLNGRFKVELSSNNQLVDLRENAVCLDNVYQLCASSNKVKSSLFGEEVYFYGVVYSDKQFPVLNKEVDGDVSAYSLLDLGEYTLMDVESCEKAVSGSYETIEKNFYTVMNWKEYGDHIDESFRDEPFFKTYEEMYGLNYTRLLYCYKTDLRDTERCQEHNNFWYGFVKNAGGDFNTRITQEYVDRINQWNLYQDVKEITYLDKGMEDPSPQYEPDACTVSLDKDYYLEQGEVLVRYGNAPEDCRLTLSGTSSGAWEVSGNGEVASSAGAKGKLVAELACGATCKAKDEAMVDLSAISNLMSSAFMITPFLEDVRGNSWWTRTGEGSFYAGEGFVRYDRCELSCDAKRECHLLSGCSNAEGGTEECSTCDKSKKDYSSEQCTADSEGVCGGGLGDCWDKICKVDAKSFSIEAPIGGTDFYGIPYRGSCPEGFSLTSIPIYHHQWIPLEASGETLGRILNSFCKGAGESKGLSYCTPMEGNSHMCSCQTCSMGGGVLGITTFEFASPEDVDIAFMIDSSSSMDNEWRSLCNIIDAVVKEAEKKGSKITYTIYSLGDKFSSAASGCTNMQLLPCEKLNEDLDGYIECINCEYEGCQKESWAAATVWAAKKHPWKGNAKRVVIPISDEDADCGDDGGGDGWSRIDEALNAASTAGIQVYGLWGDEGNSPSSFVRKEMESLSEQTNGKAGLFSDQATMISWLVEMATESPDEAYAVANSREIRTKPSSGNSDVWVYYQEGDDAVGSIAVPPSLYITETGNMPYSVKYARLVKEGDNRYRLIRVYVPDDPMARFTVKTDIVLNYTVLENAKSFNVDLNTTYVTNVRRDKYYATCSQNPCECSCEGKEFIYASTGGCGGTSNREDCDCSRTDDGGCECDYPTFSRQDIDSEVSTVVYNERDHIYVPGVSHRDICSDTLKQLKIEGLFYQEVDENGVLTIYTRPEKPLKITVSPDIVGAFSINVNKSYIYYNGIVYQARHDLTAKRSSPLPDAEWSSLDERYDYYDERYVSPQCEKVCPSDPVCKASPDDIFTVKCIDFESLTGALVERTDCAFLASGCYPNPCLSERSFHEWEGSFIANGDFEEGQAMWQGDGSVELHGESGHMLKLKGSVYQDIPDLHVKPYGMLCLDYAVNEHKKGGEFSVYLTLDGQEEKHTIWEYSEDCSDCKAWEKKCIPVEGLLSKVMLESTVEVYVDNINMGKYFDYVGLYAYEVERMEYMDHSLTPYNSMSLLSTGGISHLGNTYQLSLYTSPRKNIESSNYTINDGVDSVIAQLDDGNPSAVIRFLESNGEEISSDAAVVKGVDRRWDLLSGGATYLIQQGDENTLNIYGGGQKTTYLTVSDIRGGNIVVSTFFGDIVVPLQENVGEGERCYVVDLEFRDPSRIEISPNPKGYSISSGTPVKVDLVLTKLDETPLSEEKVYIGLEGQDIWPLSPEGLERDMLFNYNEVAEDENQQENLVELMRYLGYDTLADSMEGAEYRVEREWVLNITTSSGGELAVIEAVPIGGGQYRVYLKAGCVEDLEIGLVDNRDEQSPEYTVFESEEHRKRGFLVTAADGSASFSFKPKKQTTITARYFGEKASHSTASISIGVVGLRSPLLSGPFIILALILLFGVFSFRYFKDKRFDLESWLRDFRGRK